MPLFDAQVLKQLDRLVLEAHGGPRPWNRRRRRLPGGGTEWTGLRDYSPGDDYRTVHWGICARRDDMVTRTCEGEEDQRLDIYLDCSAGMMLGRPAKFDVARQLAALVALCALARGDRVALAAYGRPALAELPPGRSAVQRAAVVRFLESLTVGDGTSSLADAAQRAARRRWRAGECVVIADLGARDALAAGLDRLRHCGVAPLVVLLYAERDAHPRWRGDAQLLAPLAPVGERVLITEEVLASYRRRFWEELAALEGVCRKRGLRCVQLAAECGLERIAASLLHGAPTPAVAAPTGRGSP